MNSQFDSKIETELIAGNQLSWNLMNQMEFINWPELIERLKYYNSNCYIGTSYRGDTLSNSQYSLHTWILL